MRKAIKPWLLKVYVPTQDGVTFAVIPTRWKDPKEATKMALAMMCDTGAPRFEVEKDQDDEGNPLARLA